MKNHFSHFRRSPEGRRLGGWLTEHLCCAGRMQISPLPSLVSLPHVQARSSPVCGQVAATPDVTEECPRAPYILKAASLFLLQNGIGCLGIYWWLPMGMGPRDWLDQPEESEGIEGGPRTKPMLLAKRWGQSVFWVGQGKCLLAHF